jgi:hypothetical protein
VIDLPALEDFCAHITIPSKDIGLVKFDHLYGTQRFLLEEYARGLEDGIHDFTVEKGRQEGITTIMDAVRIWWPQYYEGTQGLFVSNSDENRDHRRDVCLEMLMSLPRDYRLRVRVNNKNLLAWPNARLMFDAAGSRSESDLGRSRGVNFLDADEVGLWESPHDIEALRASLSDRHPKRFYSWNGTARGFNHFWDMCQEAQKAATQRFIFIGWYRHELYRINEDEQPAVWEQYNGRLTSEERAWMREVKRLYGLEITAEQVVWYRYVLEEKFYGDEAMRAQEFPCLPEDAFQAFGDRFIPTADVARLRLDAKKAPKPLGYRYEVAPHWDESKMVKAPVDQAPLLVWEEPEQWGAYIVAGHPWGSSSANATQWVAQVYRAWPDSLVQVAEYTADEGTTYGFAWLLMYLCGAYNLSASPFLIVEANGPGYAVMNQIKLFQELGYGLSSARRAAGLQDFAGAFRRYFYARPDNLAWKSAPLDWKTNPDIRPYLLHSLADTVIRGHMTVRSAHLINSLAGLRRGESGDNDQIEGGAGRSDAHAICAALAVKAWTDFAMMDLVATVAPKAAEKMAPTTVTHQLVAGFMDRLVRTGRTR